MKQTKKSIPEELIRKYERSVLSKEGSDRNLRIVIHMEKEFPAYFDYEKFEQAQILDEDIRDYESRNWIFVTRRDADDKVTDIELNTEKIDEICSALHISTENMINARYASLLRQYRDRGIDWYIDDVLARISSYKSIKSYVLSDMKLQEDLLKSLSAMMKLEDDTLERIFSADILGDSKAFEKISSKVISVLKTYDLCNPEDTDQEILAQYHILKNPGHLIMKGHGRIRVGKSILNIEDFSDGLTLSSVDIQNAEILEIKDTEVMTIENLTSFYQCNMPDTLIIYLGGYHNTVRREFLIRLYNRYPSLQYMHFGDIDAGGFYILEHLKTKTGIPFQPYRMNAETLKKYKKQAVPLTEHDRKRLQKLRQNPVYSETIRYMLENNIKLEQEHINTV